MVKDLPVVKPKQQTQDEKQEEDETRRRRQHSQQSRMRITRSEWEPCWGPVFKNKDHFAEMHIC